MKADSRMVFQSWQQFANAIMAMVIGDPEIEPVGVIELEKKGTVAHVEIKMDLIDGRHNV